MNLKKSKRHQCENGRSDRGDAGLIWASVDMDIIRPMGKTGNINVMLSSQLTGRINLSVVTNQEYGSLSGFLPRTADVKILNKKKIKL